jgi:dipeptidyl aminopeptidase/acylaminoacyl peptidase
MGDSAGLLTAPYGSWKSPISAELAASSASELSDLTAIECGGVFWIERRPDESGRAVIMHMAAGKQINDIIPAGFNARTRVHEYGGLCYIVVGRTVYFSNFGDQRIYRQDLGSGQPVPFTSEPGVFYADPTYDSMNRRIIFVREKHTSENAEAENTIASLDIERGGSAVVLIGGNDFYSSPRVSPDGKKLAWLTWNHPSMPFYSTELWLGDISSGGSISGRRKIAGGKDECISEPRWSPDGTLFFVSDRQSGWWNIHAYRKGAVECISPADADFSRPAWVFGISHYAFLSGREIVCTYSQKGIWHLGVIDAVNGSFRPVASEYTDFSYVQAAGGRAYFIASSPAIPPSLVSFHPVSGVFEKLYTSRSSHIPGDMISFPEHLTFPASDGGSAYALYYAPRNSRYVPPAGELPPLIVMSHGGPTSAASTRFNLGIQYWTSRGFAVLDVNYRGSSGYGRAYRMKLEGQWGIADVDDCVSGALFLSSTGRADRNRLLIRGGSAGGYTTLCALAFRKVFRAGASYYGLSDLELLVRETHKFESRYLESLVGPYPGRKDIYRERSAIHHVEGMDSPVILFQGKEDRVVPPDQAELIFNALKGRGIPTSYLLFEGEQHGFRDARNIKRSFEAEYYFYSRILKFETAEKIEPVEIENLK